MNNKAKYRFMQIIPLYTSTTGRSPGLSLHVCTYRLFINAMPEVFKSKYIISDHRQNGTEIILWKLILLMMKRDCRVN